MKNKLSDFFRRVRGQNVKQTLPACIPAEAGSSTADFIADTAEGLQALLHKLADQGYFFQLRMDPPVVEKIKNGTPVLMSDATLCTDDGKSLLSLRVSEDNREVTAFYPNPALKSLWDTSLCVIYKVSDPHDATQWHCPRTSGDFASDLVKVSNFMQFLPDPQKMTRFRGMVMKSLID